MRQAGRYLPEYRRLREKAGDFLKLCFTPELAAEATLQPVRRFGFDAAILFSDILVIPYALGQSVQFTGGEGPQLEAIADRGGLARLKAELDHRVLAPIYDAIKLSKADLPQGVALLGFCGAPWTVASYMIAGSGTAAQEPARRFAYEDPDGFAELIERLIDASASYLLRQFEAGVDAVQIFDTWAGVLPAEQLRRWCIDPTRRIVAQVRRELPGAKIIAPVTGQRRKVTARFDFRLPRIFLRRNSERVSRAWRVIRRWSRCRSNWVMSPMTSTRPCDPRSCD